ncbi:Conserved oligomeric Golgi complex subunit 7 [Echinococcus granulosus]|nr:Conserved oligomeric Golgi complex subunit 7 [Echinococcus granulosus]
MEVCESASGSSGSEIEMDEGVVEYYRCLLCKHETTKISEFFQHLEDIHHWKLQNEKKLFTNQYTWIAFVNWSRKNGPSQWNDFLSLSEEDRQPYLQPFIQDDPVLMIDVESFISGSDDTSDDGQRTVDDLQQRNEDLLFQLSKCKQLIGELMKRPNLEYSQSLPESNHVHMGYGLNKRLFCVALRPIRFFLDKLVLKTFRDFIKQNHGDRILGKVVLNLFEDAGVISVFAAKAGAKRVFLPVSPFVESAKALAKSNNCEEKLEVVPSLSSLPVDRIDVLFWDWLGAFLLNSDQSGITSLIQSKIDVVYPRTLYLDIVGVNVKQEVVKCLVPSCTFEDLNTAPLTDAAYRNVYSYDWSCDLLTPVTNIQMVVTVDIQKTASFLFEEKDILLAFSTAAKVNGLLMYLRCELDGSKWSFSTEDSGSYGQSLILLKRPIDGLPDQETRDFLTDDFDHKSWINRTLQSVANDANAEAAISSLLLTVQRMLETANQEVENTFREVAQAIPRILRNIESVNQQAILLRDHMDSVEKDFRNMHLDDSGVIRELERLDCERQRAKKAADALREANRWSMLVNSRQALMEGDANVDQLYQLILDMDQSLVYLEQMPDYADRKALLNATKDRLETLVAPQFMELLDAITQSTDSRLPEQLQHMIAIFSGLNRSSVAVRYYVTWLVNRMKENWDNSNCTTMEEIPFLDQSVGRVHRYFCDVITFLTDQLELKLFADESQVPLLRALTNALETASAQITQSLFEECDSPTSRLHRCAEMLKVSENFADQLCHLLKPNDDAKLELCFDVVRKLCLPFSAISEIFKSYASENLQEICHIIKPTYTNESIILDDLQTTSDRLSECLADLLTCAVSLTKGIALASLLDAVHDATKLMVEKWENALKSFANHLIEQDRAIHYKQACGTKTALLLVSATGALSMKIGDFVKKFDGHLGKVFSSSESKTGDCTSSVCPFHSLLLPLIGESQPCADWYFLLPHAPQSDLLKAPAADSSNPITPSSVLLSRLADLCKASVAMSQRVAMTPVHAILAVVPKMTLWASHPASGEAKLPDLAYLPQEYITQLGQYIFNLPEHLLPFMDTSEDVNSTSLEQGAALVHCLRLTDPCTCNVYATAGNRPRLSSGAETISSPSIITAWLDWLLSGQVAEAFVKVILEIPSPLQVPNSDSKSSPGLTAHGAKQLLTDLDYFLALLEELGLPRPGDLASLRDLINASPEEFKGVSEGRSPRLVGGVINLRML